MRTSGSLLSLLLLSGCIIGTWPTPEAKDASGEPNQQATAEELCDTVDNDADGVVDEGCACSPGDERGCVGVVDGQCGLGVQRCSAGLWSPCTSVGPPWSALRQPAIELVDASPPALMRGGTEVVTVRAVPTAACASIQVARVEASLASTEPQVRVVAAALDDGVDLDGTALDGEFTARLMNVFGPGVPAQPLILKVTATIAGQEVFDATTIPLEEP